MRWLSIWNVTCPIYHGTLYTKVVQAKNDEDILVFLSEAHLFSFVESWNYKSDFLIQLVEGRNEMDGRSGKTTGSSLLLLSNYSVETTLTVPLTGSRRYHCDLFMALYKMLLPCGLDGTQCTRGSGDALAESAHIDQTTKFRFKQGPRIRIRLLRNILPS